MEKDKVSSKSDKSASMSDTAFVQAALSEVYTPRRFGSVKAAQIAAYHDLRKRISERPLTLRRVRSFFEGTARVVRGEEKDAVRAARIEEAQREYRDLHRRLSQLDAELAALDASFARQGRDEVGSGLR